MSRCHITHSVKHNETNSHKNAQIQSYAYLRPSLANTHRNEKTNESKLLLLVAWNINSEYKDTFDCPTEKIQFCTVTNKDSVCVFNVACIQYWNSWKIKQNKIILKLMKEKPNKVKKGTLFISWIGKFLEFDPNGWMIAQFCTMIFALSFYTV